jgi:hypothetical protein
MAAVGIDNVRRAPSTFVAKGEGARGEKAGGCEKSELVRSNVE